ncbi:MAG: rod shape-determining protein MreC [bacterium]|nr:rod shape-determining protein MreC [bacterium]
MKQKFKLTIPPRYTLAILSFVCIILAVVSFKYKDSVAPVKTLVGSVMTPMQKGINQVGSYVHSKTELITSIEKLTKENETLQNELNDVTANNKVLQQEQYELNTLRELYKLDQKYSSYPKVAAEVLERSSNWYSTIKIDKGTKDGLAVDMNVIAGEGLVGIITEVGYNYSTVRLITDDNSNVSGMFLKTGDTCNVNGNLQLVDSGLMNLNVIKKDATVESGYEVVTSKISERFLPNILIGYVETVETGADKVTKTGYIRPAVDFSKLDTVLVITQLKEKLLDTDPNASATPTPDTKNN